MAGVSYKKDVDLIDPRELSLWKACSIDNGLFPIFEPNAMYASFTLHK